MTYKKMVTFVLAGLLLVGGESLAASSAEKFPNRAITLIVPYSPGGDTDGLSRVLCEIASKDLGVVVMVKNVTGAGGTLGVVETKNSNPDGYTVGVVTLGGISMNPHVMKVPYKFDDFEYLLGIGKYSYVIGVPAKSPVKTMDDFVKWAKASKEPLKFGSTSLPTEIIAYEVAKAHNFKIAKIPFTSGPETIISMLNGHVDFIVNNAFAGESFIKTGELRYLATTSAERPPWAPDVPTLKELGYDVDIYSLIVLATPSQVSKERNDILFNAFRKAMNDKKFIDMQKKYVLDCPPIEREEIKKIMRQKYDEYGKIIRKLGITQQKK